MLGLRIILKNENIYILILKNIINVQNILKILIRPIIIIYTFTILYVYLYRVASIKIYTAINVFSVIPLQLIYIQGVPHKVLQAFLSATAEIITKIN